MRSLTVFALALLAGCGGTPASPVRDESAVMVPVKAFYQAFGEDFAGPADFATDDWNHINPLGGRAQGRDAVLKDVRAVHSTFLKGASDTIVRSDVRFASDDMAVATVVSQTSPFVMPGQTVAAPHRWIRTFVVVRRGERWLVMQDHNTEIASVPPAAPEPTDRRGTP